MNRSAVTIASFFINSQDNVVKQVLKCHAFSKVNRVLTSPSFYKTSLSGGRSHFSLNVWSSLTPDSSQADFSLVGE